ncbi:hydrogenase formation protein HypD [Rodentibacter rarus]|uniref:Hydrogenase maturation factor n=1 Tax=Rodentibacter rarus TaxID=1908260 RepID=A0A1V3IP40_9PAST|nr:hydrogenase formation protein HypD [Rodentibacter rarus]OOF43896.1 hydrogenase formation protein HypD [Rodentibacter rarus]
MKFVDEFRHPELARSLVKQLEKWMEKLPHFSEENPLYLMEVCGGHTHTIFKFGLDRLLPKSIEFIHGPGCPVCVLPMGRIDVCIEIALKPNVIFCTFGDAMRVRGRKGSLLEAKSRGADVRIVYSPLDALNIAQRHPDKSVVFFSLGFETTMPSTAITLQQAKKLGTKNFWIVCQNITIIPTLHSLLAQDQVKIDGFIAPGHVSMVIGCKPYQSIVDKYRKPFVVTGFEPLDILQAIVMLVQQFVEGRCEIENQYKRIVENQGNLLAQNAMRDVFQLKSSSEWRGLGEIEQSGVELTADYRQFDAEIHFQSQTQKVADDPNSRCGDVLIGRCKPSDCPLFGTGCHPDNAYGALMVSSEGACAAYYQYRRE